jgi:hypothetical protein
MSWTRSTLAVYLVLLALIATPSLVLAETSATCGVVTNGGFEDESVENFQFVTPTNWTSTGSTVL